MKTIHRISTLDTYMDAGWGYDVTMRRPDMRYWSKSEWLDNSVCSRWLRIWQSSWGLPTRIQITTREKMGWHISTRHMWPIRENFIFNHTGGNRKLVARILYGRWLGLMLCGITIMFIYIAIRSSL